jgi:hypothetical protein
MEGVRLLDRMRAVLRMRERVRAAVGRTKMFGEYQVRLIERNEGLEYRDDHDIYWFDLALKDRTWTVLMPPSRGHASGSLTDLETRVILPRIAEYLARIWWFGVFPVSYSVRFVEASTGHMVVPGPTST